MAESFVPKMQRVTEGLQTLAKYNAPESDVMAYMQANGVTPAHLRQYEAIAKAQASPPEQPNALARFQRGMRDIPTGIGQLTGTLPQVRSLLSNFPGVASGTDSVPMTDEQAKAAEMADVQRYEAAVGPGIDWMRITGQGVGTAPLAAIPAAGAGGLLARTAVGAATGGLGGGILYAKDANERMANTAGGALGGAAFGAAAPAIASGIGSVANRVGDAVDATKGFFQNGVQISATIDRGISDAAENAGTSIKEIGESYINTVRKKAEAALKAGEPFDFDAALRQARAERFGFTGDSGLLRGQATRDPRTFSTELNLAKRPQGAPLAERMNNQLAQAEKYMDDLARQPDLDPIDAGEGLRNLAGARAEAMQADVRAAYQAVPNGGEFPVDALQNRTASILDDFEDKISSGVKKRLNELIDPEIDRAPTMDELIKLDKLIGDTMPPGDDAAVNLAAGKLRAAVVDVMGDAADAQGDDATKAAYVAAKNIAKKRFDKIGPHGGLVSQLVHGKIDPTQVAQKVTTGKIDDLRRLKDFMFAEAEKGPVNRWETVRRMVENQIQQEARPGGQFSQAAYDRAIKRIGKARLTEIFDEGRAKELIDFRDVARDLFRYPQFHTINTSNTAPEAANIVGDLAGGLLDMAPGGRLAGLLTSAAKKGKAASQAEKETARVVMGLLSGQPSRVPRANPALPVLPAIRAAAPSAGLLTSEWLQQGRGQRPR